MKRERVSLQVVAFNYILLISVALILVIGAVTLVNNFFSTMRSYKRETANSMEYVVSLIGVSYLEKLFDDTREIYENIPDEVAADEYSDEYISYFVPLIDDEFWEARDLIVLSRQKHRLDSISLFFPDVDRERAVFVIDGYDLEDAYIPGQYLSTEESDIDTPEEMDKVASSDLILTFGYGELNGWIATNYIRIYDSKGDFLGYCTCDVNITDFLTRQLRSAIIYIVGFVAVVVLMAYSVRYFMKKRIISPINTLAVTAEEYTKRDKTVEKEGKPFFDNLSISTNDEIETLYHSLSDMETDISTTMKRVREMTADQERAAAEMNLAARIQSDMLPSSFPLFPDRDDFDVYATMDPAKEVGGDFYDVFLIDDSHLCFVIADVSGKGVPAALFMVISKTLVNERAHRGGKPSEILFDVNNVLNKGNTAFMFVTVWLAILDLDTGEMMASNAGHEKPVFIRSDGKCTLVAEEHGAAMGVVEDLKQKDLLYTMSPGDRVLIYTDGLPEATNAEGKRLGESKMIEIIQKYCDDDNYSLLTDIRRDVDDFVKDAPQFDDITMMVVTYKGKKE